MVQKYLVDVRDKSGVFGFEKFVDDFGYKNCHRLMKDNWLCNEVFFVYFSFVVNCVYFVEKMDNYHFGFVKFVGNH